MEPILKLQRKWSVVNMTPDCQVKGRPLALHTNIRLGLKGLPGTNTLAYYKHLKNSYKKFYNIGPCLHQEKPSLLTEAYPA
jgi:hypothetical protein